MLNETGAPSVVLAASGARRIVVGQPAGPSRGRLATMPDIDRTVDIEVTAAPQGVTAAIPLAGHASEYWLTLFRGLAGHRMQTPVEAEQREDRTWVLVKLPMASTELDAGAELDAASALISEVNGLEQQFQSGAAQTEAAIRGWWAQQQ
jgi:hypothetical protein